MRCSQAEATKVLKVSIDFHEDTISEICSSRCYFKGYEEIHRQLPAERKAATNN